MSEQRLRFVGGPLDGEMRAVVVAAHGHYFAKLDTPWPEWWDKVKGTSFIETEFVGVMADYELRPGNDGQPALVFVQEAPWYAWNGGEPLGSLDDYR